MREFLIHPVTFPHRTFSGRAAGVMRLFGMDRRDVDKRAFSRSCRLQIGPGQICLITGPSGSGKTLLMRELYNSLDPAERLHLNEIPLEDGPSAVDCIEGTLEEAMRSLCRAGLGDVFAMLNCPARLSRGQQDRYRLARALRSGRQFLFADEFGSGLDRPGARMLAFQIRRAIRNSGQVFFAASCREDLAEDLKPDLIIPADWKESRKVRQTQDIQRQTG